MPCALNSLKRKKGPNLHMRLNLYCFEDIIKSILVFFKILTMFIFYFVYMQKAQEENGHFVKHFTTLILFQILQKRDKHLNGLTLRAFVASRANKLLYIRDISTINKSVLISGGEIQDGQFTVIFSLLNSFIQKNNNNESV